MPGAFAHITAVNFAAENSALKGLANMPREAKLILSGYMNYLEFGCVSPDYPYLKLGDAAQNRWADHMHLSKTGDFIKEAIKAVRDLSGSDQERAFAWLCGYVAHVIADITIHPVVELRVGSYEQNKSEHRTCEMHQDSFIWEKLNLGPIGLADRVKDNIGSCSEEHDPDTVNSTIKQIWGHCLASVHPDYSAACPPDIDGWHRGFLGVVDKVDEGYRLFPFARHVAASHGLVYPDPKDLDPTYIVNLETPIGTKNYSEIFDLAVSNIREYWCTLANAIFSDGDDAPFLNWNLDTGKAENGKYTAWGNV